MGLSIVALLPVLVEPRRPRPGALVDLFVGAVEPRVRQVQHLADTKILERDEPVRVRAVRLLRVREHERACALRASREIDRDVDGRVSRLDSVLAHDLPAAESRDGGRGVLVGWSLTETPSLTKSELTAVELTHGFIHLA